ncbi:MAG TPA: RNA polymerase sigma factor [Polyangiaceae bacterium]|nr:RNA polymerase sigma factor [Polyangiaceae bacterium]
MPPARNPQLRIVRSALPEAQLPLSDDDLLEGLIRGDRGLGSELCGRMMRVVDGTLYRVLGRREADHDDLVQASFEQIVISLNRGKFSRECSLSTWASAITCNVALHAIRRRRTERRIFDDGFEIDALSARSAGTPDPESQAGSREELARVRRHLSRMSEKLARTLLLHDMVGCSLAETATITGVSMAAAQSRLVRGRKELAVRLSEELERMPKGARQ